MDPTKIERIEYGSESTTLLICQEISSLCAGARPAGGGQPRPGDPYEYSGPNRDVTKYPVFADRGLDRGYDRGGGGGGYERGYRQPLPPPSRRDPFPPPGRSGRAPGGIDSFSGRPIITYRDWDAPNDDYF